MKQELMRMQQQQKSWKLEKKSLEDDTLLSVTENNNGQGQGQGQGQGGEKLLDSRGSDAPAPLDLSFSELPAPSDGPLVRLGGAGRA